MAKKSLLLNRWQEAENALFPHLPTLPLELREELQALMQWHAWVGELLLQRDQIIARLDRQWLEREEAARRARAISQRQCMSVAAEQEAARLRKIESRIRALRARIDRVCDQVTEEMERRRQMALQDANQQAQQQAQQVLDDLLTWRLYVQQLQDDDAPAAYDPQAEKEARRQAAQQARVQAEIRKLRQQNGPSATDEENQAAWMAFVQSMEDSAREDRP